MLRVGFSLFYTYGEWMFIKLDCGCVGIIVNGGMDSIDLIMVERCDRQEGDEIIFSLERSSRSWKDLEEDGFKYLDRISSLIVDGYRYREIKRLPGN